MVKFDKVFHKKLTFLLVQPKKPISVSNNCGQKLEKDLHRGQPLAKISTAQTIWHVCRVFSFLGYLVQKLFYLEERQIFFKFFSSSLGSKKLRFVHTTKLARECMWKALFSARKMRPKTFQYKLLTLTYGNFLLNRNSFPEFPQILSKEFLLFNSTIVVNYPNQASFEFNGVFRTAFLFPRAFWIVSAGPSGHLKQSIQKTFFEQRSTSTRRRALKPKNLFHNCPSIVVTSSLYFGTVLFFRRRLDSDQYRKTHRKTL